MMKHYLFFLCFVSLSAYAQQTAKSPKFSVYTSLQVINRPTTVDGSRPYSYVNYPNISYSFREQNVGFGLHGSVELMYNPWKTGISFGMTQRYAKLYNVMRTEEIRDSTHQIISATYDYNKWAPVTDIHFELVKYIKLKNERSMYVSVGTNEFFRSTHVYGRMINLPDSNLYNRDMRIFGYSFSTTAMNIRIGVHQKNLSASIGVYFPGTDLWNFYFDGGFKAKIPEFRLGYRFKVL